MIDIKTIQAQQADWAEHNFPQTKLHHPLLGIMEEVGELAHAHLKLEQGIRGNEDLIALQKDAVGDIAIFLLHYCSLNGIDFLDTLVETWKEVRKRDWIKYPKNGVSE